VGWQLSRGAAVVNGYEIKQILALETKFGEFTVRANDTAADAYRIQTGQQGIALPDPTAMAILLDPSLSLVASQHYLDVQIDSGITRGMSVVDRLGVAEDARNRAVWSEVIARGRKQTVLWEMDVPGWKQALLRALR
jgi:inosine-uridine nucleoside N-ribohydrolase